MLRFFFLATAIALPPDADRVRVQESFGRLPLYFIENQGQLDQEAASNVRGADKTLCFTAEGGMFTGVLG